jgi:FAD:protein FMN transferase
MTTLEVATPVRNGTASWPGLGTYVHLSTADETALEPARQIAVRLLEDVDRTCSRFRKDSDLIRANAGAGSWVSVDPMLVKAVGAAVESAAQTDGLVDPTLGHALVAVGYDRDISLVLAESSDPAGIPVPARAGAWPVAITETIDDPAGAEVVHLP